MSISYVVQSTESNLIGLDVVKMKFRRNVFNCQNVTFLYQKKFFIIFLAEKNTRKFENIFEIR